MLALLSQRQRELARARRLAGSLKPHHHDYRRRLRRHIYAALHPAHQLGKLVIDNFYDSLRGCQCLKNFLTYRPLLDAFYKILDNLEINISLKQRHANIAHGLIYIVLGQLSVSAQLFECCLKPF